MSICKLCYHIKKGLLLQEEECHAKVRCSSHLHLGSRVCTLWKVPLRTFSLLGGLGTETEDGKKMERLVFITMCQYLIN